MILRSYRDVEIEFRKVIAAIADLNNLVNSSKPGSGLTNADVIALINTYSARQSIVNAVETAPKDIDTANAGTLIIHKLVHQFLEKVIFDSLITVNDNLTVNGNLIVTGSVGSSTQRVLKGWFRDLSVLPGLTPSVVNQVLAAADTVGTVKWITPATTTNFSQQVDSTTSYLITTSFITVPGLVITLPTPGKYLLTASLVIGVTVNDSEIRGILIHNDSGGFVTVNGMIRVAKDAAASQIIATASKSWIITTTVVNVIAGIQIAKLAGTGTSVSDLTNSTFIAAKVG